MPSTSTIILPLSQVSELARAVQAGDLFEDRQQPPGRSATRSGQHRDHLFEQAQLGRMARGRARTNDLCRAGNEFGDLLTGNWPG